MELPYLMDEQKSKVKKAGNVSKITTNHGRSYLSVIVYNSVVELAPGY